MTNRGFTLIEILISLLITAALILAVNKVVYTVKKTNFQAENNYQASVYAQNIFEYLKSNKTILSEGSFKPEEILNENMKKFLLENTKNKKFENSLIEIIKFHEDPELGTKTFEIEISIVWKGVTDVRNYKIGTYIYQK
mgnify:FL=1